MAPIMQEITSLSSSSAILATSEKTTTSPDNRQSIPIIPDITVPRLKPTDALTPIPTSFPTSDTASNALPPTSRILNTSTTSLQSPSAEQTDWLHSTAALSISCWLLVFSIFSFISLLAMWCNGTLDRTLNYYPNDRRYRRRARIVQQLPRYSNSSEENVSMDWREAIAMAPSDLVVDGRVHAPVVRPGEVVVREANGGMWRTTEEAWVRELRLQERMSWAGLM